MSESRYLSKMGTLCLITAVSTRKLEESAEGRRRKQGQLWCAAAGTGLLAPFFSKRNHSYRLAWREKRTRSVVKKWLLLRALALPIPQTEAVAAAPLALTSLTHAEESQPQSANRCVPTGTRRPKERMTARAKISVI